MTKDIILLNKLMENWWEDNKDNTICEGFTEKKVFDDKLSVVDLCWDLADVVITDKIYNVKGNIQNDFDFLLEAILIRINNLDNKMKECYGKDYDNSLDDLLKLLHKIMN